MFKVIQKFIYVSDVKLWPAKESSEVVDDLVRGGTDQQDNNSMSEKIKQPQNLPLDEHFVRNVESGKFLLKGRNWQIFEYVYCIC